jgi:hypothetical protein
MKKLIFLTSFFCLHNAKATVPGKYRPEVVQFDELTKETVGALEVGKLKAGLPTGKGIHQIAMQAHNRFWIAAEVDERLVANRGHVGLWEIFDLDCHDESCSSVSIKSYRGKWVSADYGIRESAPLLAANRQQKGPWEKFELVKPKKAPPGTVLLRTERDEYVFLEHDNLLAAYKVTVRLPNALAYFKIFTFLEEHKKPNSDL